MASNSKSLTGLVVFKNSLYPELVRSVHFYKSGEAESKVEREYLFYNESPYEECKCYKALTLSRFSINEQFIGLNNGVWLCVFVFNADRLVSGSIPPILSIDRNSKLANIPSLANDLRYIFELNARTIDEKVKNDVVSKSKGRRVTNVEHKKGVASSKKKGRRATGVQLKKDVGSSKTKGRGVIDPEVKNGVGSSRAKSSRVPRVNYLDLDLNLSPSTDEESDAPSGSVTSVISVKEKKMRAKPNDVAKLSIEDLSKHFDLPISEAAKSLKVGLTVLKKKCRACGIPRWPHRKIKSLDGLLRGLQEEIEVQQIEDESAAEEVAKKQLMIESEKQTIARKPFMDIKWETKRYRQDIFKKKHKARACGIHFRATQSS